MLFRSYLIADPNVNAPHTAQQWFNMAAFQMPSAFTFGSSGRNVVFAAPEKNIDVSLSKETVLKESARLQFRVEAFKCVQSHQLRGRPWKDGFHIDVRPLHGGPKSATNPARDEIVVLTPGLMVGRRLGSH